ncbi:MAG: hypothetical protein PHQ23_04395 [Candidatus Wallbacteria bacterium]|nr:hypothetical protein [Candidatus Wallbacteria bacterium]
MSNDKKWSEFFRSVTVPVVLMTALFRIAAIAGEIILAPGRSGPAEWSGLLALSGFFLAYMLRRNQSWMRISYKIGFFGLVCWLYSAGILNLQAVDDFFFRQHETLSLITVFLPVSALLNLAGQKIGCSPKNQEKAFMVAVFFAAPAFLVTVYAFVLTISLTAGMIALILFMHCDQSASG